MQLLLRPSPISILILLLKFHLAPARASDISGQHYPALFAFGDSILDTGNNNALQTIVKCNFPPYGKDFAGQRATGRFSNGRVPSDLIGSYMGIKELLPAYLSPELRSEDLLTGVCFASGGTGYNSLAAKLWSLLTMPEQLELFKDYKKKLQAIAGEERAGSIINRGLYVVTGGSNDLMEYFSSVPLGKPDTTDAFAYANFLVHLASNFVQGLYNLGARTIAITGVPPVGCLPSQRTVAGGINRDCVSLYNQVSQKYNYQLAKELQMLQRKLPDTKIVYIDIYNKLLDVIQHPLKYGFEESMFGCCGTGAFEISILCNNITSYTCSNEGKYVFWDSVHPTERTYEILVKRIIQEDLISGGL